jgi:uncharacterized membrane protein YqiK
MLGYRAPATDEAMLIYGGRRDLGYVPFRVVTGHGAFVMPFFRKVRYLTLAMQEAEIAEQCVTRQGITLLVRAVVAFKVGNDPESTTNAGQRFSNDQSQMPVLARRVFAGHLRSSIGSMTLEEIVTSRQKLQLEVLDRSKAEMASIGLIGDTLQIQSIDDMGAGHIKAMAAAHLAAIRQQANAAQVKAAQEKADRVKADRVKADQANADQANADQQAAMARQDSARWQEEYARQTAAHQAEYARQAAAMQVHDPSGSPQNHEYSGE